MGVVIGWPGFPVSTPQETWGNAVFSKQNDLNLGHLMSDLLLEFFLSRFQTVIRFVYSFVCPVIEVVPDMLAWATHFSKTILYKERMDFISHSRKTFFFSCFFFVSKA